MSVAGAMASKSFPRLVKRSPPTRDPSDNQMLNECKGNYLHRIEASHSCRQCSYDFLSCRIPLSMQYPSPAVSAFPRQLNTSVSLVESGAPLDEVLDLRRTFLRQNPDCLFITQTCAGRQRVGEMQFCRIGFSNSGCYPPLGIARVRFSDFSLRKDENATGWGEIQRGTQSGSTTSNDDEVRIDSLRCTAAVHALKMSQPSAGSNSETGFRLCRSGLDPKRHS